MPAGAGSAGDSAGSAVAETAAGMEEAQGRAGAGSEADSGAAEMAEEAARDSAAAETAEEAARGSAAAEMAEAGSEAGEMAEAAAAGSGAGGMAAAVRGWATMMRIGLIQNQCSAHTDTSASSSVPSAYEGCL